MFKERLKFEPITEKHIKRIESIRRKLPMYCDFTALNLLNWSSDDFPTLVAFHNNNIVVQMADFTSDKRLTCISGTQSVHRTFEQVLGYIADEINLVPEETTRCLNPNQYHILEDPDNYDYILSLEKVSNLRGKQFKNKRGYVNKFVKAYSPYQIRLIRPEDKQDILEVYELARNWQTIKSVQDKYTNYNMEPIHKCIENSRYFNILILGLYIKNKLVGYTINECTRGRVARGLFGVTDLLYSGASQILEQRTATILSDLGYTHINIEQDLGLHGLRKSKRGWRPEYFLKKYKVTKSSKLSALELDSKKECLCS